MKMRLFALLLTVWCPAKVHALEIIAHRGASYDAPENTLAALKLGWQQNADACELDIHLSKDGQVVLSHDASTRRITGVDKAVAAQTLAELRDLDAGRWKGPQWAGEKMPALAEALATIPEGKRMFIEIKCGPEVLPELERVIAASGRKPGQLVIIGFNYATMQQAKQRFPQVPVFWLHSAEADKKTRHIPSLDELIEKTRAAGLDGLNLNFKFPIDAAFVEKVHGAGLKLYVWTVDDAPIARNLAAAGVDGITTNRPEWLRQELR
ncbi:MAG: glycerophosphodiester phosphodiesterase [Verrucomicrobiota bacterium]|nr:glycerophosphodiester phosphodiesterase [Verrucomicrobiota bacterium]